MVFQYKDYTGILWKASSEKGKRGDGADIKKGEMIKAPIRIIT